MTINSFSINRKEREVLDQLKCKILAYHDPQDFQQLKLSKFISHEISLFAKELTETLKSDKTEALLIAGLPELYSDNKNSLNAAKCMAISFAFLIGEPFQYLQQNNGQIAAEITPTEHLKETQSSGGTVEFAWHTDDCFFSPQVRTKWISLYGFHNPEKTMTRVALLKDIMMHIPEHLLFVLMSKRFQVKLPDSIGGSNDEWTNPIALIRINGEQQFEIGVPTFDVRPYQTNDIEAALALQSLIDAANTVQTSSCIEDGCALIFDNNKALHARGAISGDRTVIRTYIRPELLALRTQTQASGHLFDAEKLTSFKAG